MPIFSRGQGQGGSAIKMRLLIAAVIAAGALISYATKCEKDPHTGEWRAVAMNPEQEIALGLQAAPQMASEMGGAIDPRSSPEAGRVSAMGQKLVDAYKARETAYAGNFHFHLLADRENINAFALPGGQIFITRALYDKLQNDAQLAGVLGHEIGHVLYRHASEHMAKGQLGQGLVGAVAVGAGDQSAAGIANAVNQIIQLKYGRKDESQSDTWGLENMVAAGYEPKEMIQVMEVLKAASGRQSGPSLFATHPNPDQRIVEIKQYIAARWPNGAPNTGPGESLNSGNESRTRPVR
ncbi:MAG: M48 family metalloprotease [Burkholderiales bacterium]|nr:M48 family metalloprotease [Phycisphaerae bacterium]